MLDQKLERKFLARLLKDVNAAVIANQRKISSDCFQWATAQKLYSINLWYVTNYCAALSINELEGLLQQSTTLSDTLKQSVMGLFVELQVEPLDTDINFLYDQILAYHKQNLLEAAINESATKFSDKKFDAAIVGLKADIAKIENRFRTEVVRSGQLDEFGDRIYEEFIDRKVNPSKYEGLKLGFGELDKVIGGLVKSSVSILLAPPKEFKTALAMNICYYNAKRGVYSVYFANEGTVELFYMRFAAMELSIPLSHIKDGKMTDMEESSWLQFITSVREGKHQILNKIYFAEVPLSLSTPSYLADLLKKLQKEGKEIGLVIIDHFGRCTTSSKEVMQDWQKKGIVAEELCNLARSERIPFFLLTHVKAQSAKDALEDSADFSAYDIERSGQPLKDVDYVFSWRIENRESFDRNGKCGFARLSLVMSRHSETCSSTLQINGKYMQIQEIQLGGTLGASVTPVPVATVP